MNENDTKNARHRDEDAVAQLRVAVDIGGTFTDVVLTEGHKIVHSAKVLTTYGDLLTAIRSGIQSCMEGREIELSRNTDASLLHATTLVSNSFVERKGSSVSLVCTRGFKDMLEVRDGRRFDVWDLDLEFAEPLVLPKDTFEVSERSDYTGLELEPVSLEELAAIAPQLQSSVAVLLLHSYVDPTHERLVGEELRRLRPDLDITLSSDVSREAGEFVRATTTVANAFVRPLVKPYLTRLTVEAQERISPTARLLVMLSNGGLCPVSTAAELPVRIAESGPAAGVTAAHSYLANSTVASESRAVVGLDMGGTTAKVAFFDRDLPLPLVNMMEVARDDRHRPGSGMSLLVPSLDLIEIGAGGGSIARRDQLGLIEVGPESASSEPGPAAYGRGGAEPTVTDANVVLGYLPPWQRLGGVEALHPQLAQRAVASLSADESADELAVQDLALAIHSIANEHMASAIRVAAAERAVEPDTHILIASGGAAPLHACGVANRVGITAVIIPPEPGVFSAVGLALAPLKYEALRTFRRQLPLSEGDMTSVKDLIEEMISEVSSVLTDGLSCLILADIRFVNQHHPLTIALGSELPETAEIEMKFKDEYVRLYGRLPEAQVEIVGLRVQGSTSRPDVSLDIEHQEKLDDELLQTWAVFETEGSSESGATQSPRISRLQVPAVSRTGSVKEGIGPALITESHTTTVVPPGWQWRRESDGALLLQKVKGKTGA